MVATCYTPAVFVILHPQRNIDTVLIFQSTQAFIHQSYQCLGYLDSFPIRIVKTESITTVDTVLAMEEVNEPEPPSATVIETVLKTEVTEQPKPQIPPKPSIPPEAAIYPKLQKVKTVLDKHNNLIFETEHERIKLEIERDDLRVVLYLQ